MSVVFISILLTVFLINIPFGYWRENVRKFSWQWIVAIHAPVPAVIAMRIYSGLGFQLWSVPFMVAAYFGGQFLGSRISRRWRASNRTVTSCFVRDFFSKSLS